VVRNNNNLLLTLFLTLWIFTPERYKYLKETKTKKTNKIMMMIIIIIMAINDALVMAARPASRSRLYAHNAYQISAESSNGWLSY